jgi:hypothetical protein
VTQATSLCCVQTTILYKLHIGEVLTTVGVVEELPGSASGSQDSLHSHPASSFRSGLTTILCPLPAGSNDR